MKHRERFSTMPPLLHNWKKPENSEVLQHIQQTTGCDLAQAKGTFTYLRNRGILVFRRPPYRWQGLAYVREATQAEINADLMAKIRTLEGDIYAARKLALKLQKKYYAHIQILHPDALKSL